MSDNGQWAYIQDLISAGSCSPQCLFGMKPDDTCECRCKGESHGIAAKAIADGAGGDALIGKFFHSFVQHPCGHNVAEWQGIVVGKISRGRYLVQLFDWIVGAPSHHVVVSWKQIKGWQIYRDAVAMSFEYEYRGLETTIDRHSKCEVTND